MVKTLGGVTFIKDGIRLDYCYEQTIRCLAELCDQVVVVDAGSTDGTTEDLQAIIAEYTNVHLVKLTEAEWLKHEGREKISFFQNLAKSFLTTDYYICCQSDEIIHEDSYKAIRTAIETGGEGFYCRRINLWGDSQHYLDVPIEIMPVGIQILRLAKIGYMSIDDGESIHTEYPVSGFMEDIRIYHMGFVRSSDKHIKKIKHIQEDIFLYPEMDPRVTAMGEKFNPWAMFSKEDVKQISEPLPKVIQSWAAERDKINNQA